MSDEQVRQSWLRFRRSVSDEAEAMKQSQAALFALFERYRRLPVGERHVIDRLLADDVQSDDEGRRFDALAIIREFRIVSALPALRALAARLENASEPSAPYEWAKVNRTIGLLDQGLDR